MAICHVATRMRWGCVLSIYAEIMGELKRQDFWTQDDNGILVDRFIDSFPKEDVELFNKETGFVFEFMSGRGDKPDFEQICERAIMERFADEEAARKKRMA